MIQQVSSKDDQGKDANVTGKFGTGFITTHLLSRMFNIYGIAKSKKNEFKKFEMRIDRDASNSHDMGNKIKIALDVLRDLGDAEYAKDYDTKRKESDMDTIFEYPLTDETYKSANIGCDDLIKVMPYTLLFINKIKKVTIIKENEKKKYTVQRNNQIIGDGIELPEIIAEVFNLEDKLLSKETHLFIMNSKQSERLNIVWPLEKKNGIFKIKAIKVETPKLFCSFPLIGSEYFFQPMVVNSGAFYPNEPRNAIFLNNAQSVQVKQNRHLLEEANKLFFELVKYSIDNNFEDFFHLFVHEPLDNQWLDKIWLMNTIFQPRIQTLLNMPIVKTKNGMKSIISMPFPKAPTKELRDNLWELFNELYNGSIVIKEELDDWYQAIGNSPFFKTIEEFIKSFSEIGSLEKMTNLPSDDKRIEFINKLIKYLKQSVDPNDKKQNNKFLLSRYPIIPNVNGVFVREKHLLTDKKDPIEDNLKIVYQKIMKKDINDFLIDHRIEIKLQIYQEYNADKLSSEINVKLASMRGPEIIESALLLTTLISGGLKASRKMLIEFLNDLKKFWVNISEFQHCETFPCKTIMKAPSYLWDKSDQIIYRFLVEKISNDYSNKGFESFSSEVLNKNENDSLEWMNKFLTYFYDVSPQLINSFPIVPNQNLSFQRLYNLYIDNQIPNTIKEILLSGNKDICSILIHPKITCFQNHQSKNVIQLIPEINQLLGYGKSRNTMEIRQIKLGFIDIKTSLKIISLHTNEELEEEDNNLIDFYELLKHVNFYGLCKSMVNFKEEIIQRDIYESIKECRINAIKCLGNFLIQKITEYQKVQSLNEILNSTYQNIDLIKQWYIKFIKLLDKTDLFIPELKNRKLFINSEGLFFRKNELFVNSVKTEKLLTISKNQLINIVWENQFVIEELKDVFCHNPIKDDRLITDSVIASTIDKKIQLYSDDKRNPQFVELVLKLRDLIDKDNFDKSLLPYFSQNKDSIIVNTLDSESLTKVATLVSEGKQEFLSLLNEKTTNVLSSIQNLNDNDRNYFLDHMHELILLSKARNIRTPNNYINIREITPRRIHQNTRINNWIPRSSTIIMPPPSPPPKKYQDLLKENMVWILRDAFRIISPEPEDPSSYLCNTSNSKENEDTAFRVINIVSDANNAFIPIETVEYACDNIGKFAVFIVPNEQNFKQESFNKDVIVLPDIGKDLNEFMDKMHDLLGLIDSEQFIFDTSNQNVTLTKAYLKHGISFDDWIKTLPPKEIQ